MFSFNFLNYKMNKIAEAKKEIKRYISPIMADFDRYVWLIRKIFEKIRPIAIEKTKEILNKIKKWDMEYIKLYWKKEDEKLFVIPTEEKDVLKNFEEIKEIKEIKARKARNVDRDYVWEINTCLNDVWQFCYKLSSYIINSDELELDIELSVYANFLEKLIHSNLLKLGYDNIKYNTIDKNLVLWFLEWKCEIYYLQWQVSWIWENNFIF